MFLQNSSHFCFNNDAKQEIREQSETYLFLL